MKESLLKYYFYFLNPKIYYYLQLLNLYNYHSVQMEKQKNLTTNLKRVSTNIQSNRKNIQSNNNIIDNISQLKSNFNQIQGIAKSQTTSIQGIKIFSKQATTQTSKNLQSKRIYNSIFDKIKTQIKAYIEIVSENFVISYKQQSISTWQKIKKDLEKSISTLQEESQSNIQNMFQSIQKLNSGKDFIVLQLLKLMVYQKNILWRDLNAPYDDYIHGQVKNVINQIKSNQQKLGYIPSKLKFQIPKFTDIKVESNVTELFRIHLGDFSQIVEGLKNYSKLSGQEQVIEDISKNQYIVKGLRQRIQKLTINYDGLMQKYRNLQISKGKVSAVQQKSLTERVEQLQTILSKKDQQIFQQKQINTKSQATAQSLRDKTKQLQQQLSKFQKYQMPKIKQLQLNQKNILEQFVKVKRDLQTYSNIVSTQRQEKQKLLEDLKLEQKRVNDLAYILGRERRKIKDLKGQINRKQQIIMQLVDEKIPDEVNENGDYQIINKNEYSKNASIIGKK